MRVLSPFRRVYELQQSQRHNKSIQHCSLDKPQAPGLLGERPGVLGPGIGKRGDSLLRVSAELAAVAAAKQPHKDNTSMHPSACLLHA